MLYGFIEDSALLTRPSSPVVDMPSLDQGCGYLSQNIENYFVDHDVIIDPRSGRSTILSAVAEGDLKFHIDNGKVDATDASPYGAIVPELEHIMNIIEYLELIDGETVADINTHLLADAATYGAYVDGTVDMASIVTDITVREVGATTEVSHVVDWIEFGIEIGGEQLMFHLWLKGDSFLTDYPHSTITKVIYPCDPSSFLNMSSYGNVVDAVSQSDIYANALADPDVVMSDHSGMLPFETRYHNSAYASDYNFSFGLLYKGKRPSTMDAITYVRTEILALGLATEATWRGLFPDLFIDGAFYLVPMWDNKHTLPTKEIFTSIGSHKKLLDKMALVFPSYNATNMTNRLEVITTSAAEFLISSLADSSNDPTTMSLNEQFPTYMAVDATTPAWNDQDAEAQHFNERLGDAVGVALGGANVNNIPTETFDGKTWLTFISKFLKIYLLKSSSYPV